MTLTSEDLLAISNLLDVKLKPIDNRLTSLEVKVDNLESKVDKMDRRLTNLEIKVDNLESKVDTIDRRLTNLEVHIENVTDKNIALLAENYVPAARQFEKASYKIEALQADNDIIKKVLGEHSGKLEKIS
ncbi:MAG: hypothetical protein K2O92_00335 [Lachnospiraceae bacterium]|nr:hypothetical protein [Lachnospiraceae bacterium]